MARMLSPQRVARIQQIPEVDWRNNKVLPSECGYISRKTLSRRVTCRGCGKAIPAGTSALRFAHDMDGRLDPTFWHVCFVHEGGCPQ